MTSRVLLRRAAQLDLEAIEDWYDREEPGLGAEFRGAFGELVGRIAANPLAFPERYRGSRRALLRRFPYIVWYRVDGDSATILACLHAKRDPRATRARLRGQR